MKEIKVPNGDLITSSDITLAEYNIKPEGQSEYWSENFKHEKRHTIQESCSIQLFSNEYFIGQAELKEETTYKKIELVLEDFTPVDDFEKVYFPDTAFYGRREGRLCLQLDYSNSGLVPPLVLYENMVIGEILVMFETEK